MTRHKADQKAYQYSAVRLCVCVQVHFRRHSTAGGTVSGPEPVEQLTPSQDPELHRAAWRCSHPRDAEPCHRPHRHQPISAQDGAAPPHTHVSQCECVTVHTQTHPHLCIAAFKRRLFYFHRSLLLEHL